MKEWDRGKDDKEVGGKSICERAMKRCFERAIYDDKIGRWGSQESTRGNTGDEC